LITRFPFKIGKKQDEKLRDINVPKKKKAFFVLSVLFEKRFFAEIVLVAFLFCPFFVLIHNIVRLSALCSEKKEKKKQDDLFFDKYHFLCYQNE